MARSTVFYVGVSTNVFVALGLLFTTWRIYFRLKIGRFWWEDAFAAILLVTGLCWNITNWICLSPDGLTSVVVSWVESIGFTCIVTLARMSLLFSIIRIIHGNPRLLKFTYACAAFFVALCLAQIVERVRHFTTECISVLILDALPLCMLWKVKLPGRQRRMILSIFASSIVIAFAAVCRTVGQILNVLIVTSVGFRAEIALSIIVCNLLVGVTYTYRFLLRDNGGSTETTEDTSDEDDFTTQPRHPALTPSTTLPLTTVDLEVSTTSGQQSSIMLEEKRN
ncbi:hypothetical protein J3R83DRAFT_9549 [Lanmaoa asiatica]|nr:hypothetical protein J3R83DRAFT_9549 [Lanmaoa asiatica]